MILPLDEKLEPRITSKHLAAIEADSSWQADERRHCADSPWYWLVNYVYTIEKDEFTADAKPEIKRFPALEHLRFVLHKCFTESYLVVDKSRQMTLSWVLMAYLLHMCQFGDHEEVIIQTKKEIDADALVKRAEFMVKGQRFWMRPNIKEPTAFCRLKFLENSCTMRGLPGGAGAGDQIRSANPSRYFLDEGGFIDEFEECRTAALACCRDIKIVSTANHGEFQKFIEDKMTEVA